MTMAIPISDAVHFDNEARIFALTEVLEKYLATPGLCPGAQQFFAFAFFIGAAAGAAASGNTVFEGAILTHAREIGAFTECS